MKREDYRKDEMKLILLGPIVTNDLNQQCYKERNWLKSYYSFLDFFSKIKEQHGTVYTRNTRKLFQ